MKQIKIGLFCLIALLAYKTLINDAEASKPTKTRAEQIRQLLTEARQYIGTPHAYGKQSKKGIDCSGLVNAAYKAIHIHIPRSSRNMTTLGQAVAIGELAPGDIVLFTHPGGKNITHSGIVTEFIDSNRIQFIHTSSSKGVVEESMCSKYWKNNYVMARRVLPN